MMNFCPKTSRHGVAQLSRNHALKLTPPSTIPGPDPTGKYLYLTCTRRRRIYAATKVGNAFQLSASRKVMVPAVGSFSGAGSAEIGDIGGGESGAWYHEARPLNNNPGIPIVNLPFFAGSPVVIRPSLYKLDPALNKIEVIDILCELYDPATGNPRGYATMMGLQHPSQDLYFVGVGGDHANLILASGFIPQDQREPKPTVAAVFSMGVIAAAADSIHTGTNGGKCYVFRRPWPSLGIPQLYPIPGMQLITFEQLGMTANVLPSGAGGDGGAVYLSRAFNGSNDFLARMVNGQVTAIRRPNEVPNDPGFASGIGGSNSVCYSCVNAGPETGIFIRDANLNITSRFTTQPQIDGIIGGPQTGEPSSSQFRGIGGK